MVKINPVKATCAKYKDTGCQMADVNNTCYEICAAFSGTTDLYNADPNCISACDKYIEERRHNIYGVGKCDHQSPEKPVIWNQVPNFVPDLVMKGIQPDIALQRGMQMCTKYVPTLVDECQDKCRLHYSAIEQYQATKMETPVIEKSNPIGFWIAVSLIIIGLVIALIAMIIKRNNTN